MTENASDRSMLTFVRPSRMVHATWAVSLIAIVTLIFAACLVKVDRVVSATGHVRTAKNISVIAAPLSGRVSSVRVKNGDTVAAGDIVMWIEPANETGMMLPRAQSRVERAELTYSALTAPVTQQPTDDQKHEQEVADLIFEKVAAERAALRAQILAARQDLEGARADLKVEMAILDRQRSLAPLYDQRLKTANSLVERGFQSRSSLLNVKQDKIESDQQLRIIEARIARATAEVEKRATALERTENEMARVRAEKLDEAKAELIESRLDFDRIHRSHEVQYVRSPIAGIVEQISTETAKNSVIAGTQLMKIIPIDANFEVELEVINKDFPYLCIGQNVKLKFDAFPYTIYGTKDAKIIELPLDVARDEAESTYKVIAQIAFDVFDMPKNKIALRSGMKVTGDIQIGQQHPIDIWLDPFIRFGDNAFSPHR